MLPVLALAGIASMARADRLDVVTARQAAPGQVVVDVAIDGSKPPVARALALEIDGVRLQPTGDVSPVGAGAAPGWLVLCIDRSGSIGEPALGELKQELIAALTTRGASELGVQVAVLGFGTQAPVAQGTFSGRTAEVVDAIGRMRVEGGGRTVLNDAVTMALGLLAAQGEGPKRVLVASDGRDTGSAMRRQQLLDRVQAGPRVPIDALSFGPQGSPPSDVLALLAGATGGRFVQAHGSGRLGPAVRALIAGEASPAVFQATFVYPAATGGRQAGTAEVLYTAEGRPPLRRPLGIAIAAASPVPDDASLRGPGDPARRSGGLMNVFDDWPAPLRYAGIALALLALLAAVLLLARRARRRTGIAEPPLPLVARTGSSGQATRMVALAAPPAPPPRRAATVVGHAWPVPARGHPAAILQGVSGAVRGQRFAVEKARYSIGGAPGNDLVLVGDDFASGRHALLRCESEGLYVKDLGSTNGSRLNGALFKGATKALAPGDELQFGRTTLEVLAPAGPPSGPAGRGQEPRVP
jgi:Mg-chelatase subunit ChlD